MHRTPRCLAQDNQITVLCTCAEKIEQQFPHKSKTKFGGNARKCYNIDVLYLPNKKFYIKNRRRNIEVEITLKGLSTA